MSGHIVSLQSLTAPQAPDVKVMDLPYLAGADESAWGDLLRQAYGAKKDDYQQLNQYALHYLKGGTLAVVVSSEAGFDLMQRFMKTVAHLVVRYHPAMDGEGHINVYSKGCTQLGRMLSNFYRAPIELVEHGRFASVEGYWYWLKTRDEGLRTRYGFDAKRYGKDVLKKGTEVTVDGFDDLIRQALTAKIEQHKDIRVALERSTLPLSHYYFYGKIPIVKVQRLDQYNWITDHFTQLRAALQQAPKPPAEELKADIRLKNVDDFAI